MQKSIHVGCDLQKGAVCGGCAVHKGLGKLLGIVDVCARVCLTSPALCYRTKAGVVSVSVAQSFFALPAASVMVV